MKIACHAKECRIEKLDRKTILQNEALCGKIYCECINERNEHNGKESNL